MLMKFKLPEKIVMDNDETVTIEQDLATLYKSAEFLEENLWLPEKTSVLINQNGVTFIGIVTDHESIQLFNTIGLKSPVEPDIGIETYYPLYTPVTSTKQIKGYSVKHILQKEYDKFMGNGPIDLVGCL